MEKKLGFGIIGCGVIADFHANALHELSNDSQLLGVCDVVYDAAEKFAKRHNTKAYQNAEEMLADPNIDIVNICTPSGYHHLSVIAAAKAGKHIICEKPLAINREQLDEIERVVKETGVVVSVISQNRYAKSVKRAKKAIEEGRLGTIVCADIYMKYHRSQEYYDSGSWRGTKRIDGGGALMNQGIHGVDLLLHLAGDIKKVYAISKTLVHNIEVEDTLSAVVEYANGATGVIQATTSVYPGYPRNLQINGNRGSVALNETSIINWDIMDSGNEDVVYFPPLGSHGASNPTAFSAEGHVFQIADMIEAVRTGNKPLSGLEDGRKAVDVILAIYKSAELGVPVEL